MRITIALLMIFLSSCKTRLVCSEVNSSKIKPLMIYDVSFKFNRCRGRCFDMNSWNTLPLKSCLGGDIETPDTAINYPLEYCEGVAGFTLEDIALEIRPNIKKLDAIKSEYCNN